MNEENTESTKIVQPRKPDTVEYIVSEQDGKALKYIRNDGYLRSLLESTLKRFEVTSVSSNQVVLIKRQGDKAASYGSVKTIKEIKGSEMMHYRLAPETSQAQFVIEVDAANFDFLDHGDQQYELYDQLSRVFLDVDRQKYMISKPVKVNLALVAKKGMDVPEARAVVRNLQLAEDNKDA